MTLRINEVNKKELLQSLKIDCKKCFGLCCVALYFSKSEGFPKDKIGGEPCMNLQLDHRCSVHNDLRKKGLKGCTSYDCFGAGQKVAQITFEGKDWRKHTDIQKEMFDVFITMRQLHEMLWYLIDASTFICDKNIENEISYVIDETEKLSNLDTKSILKIDIEEHRIKVNSMLKKINKLVQDRILEDKKRNSKNKKRLKEGYDFIGQDLTNTNLIGANFAGVLLIASNMKNSNLEGANLIGADFRDVDIRGAILTDSMFLTQSQVNVAKGNSKTKLPNTLEKPSYWED